MTFRLALAFTLITSGLVSAQFPQQQAPTRPAFSPYLNLLRNGAPLYQNYYGLVQPQIQTQNQLNQLSQDVNGLQNTPQNILPGTGNELSTGKTVGYFTHRSYFMNGGGSGAGRGISTGGQLGNQNNNTNSGPMSMQQNMNSNPVSPSSVMPFRR
ncbi:hypothetical protein BH11PLA2_BH11PLA2_42280 [soil metagenome]